MTEVIERLKYKKEISCLLEQGLMLPALFTPVNKDAFRFISKSSTKNNHLPAYKIKPQRILQDEAKHKLTTNGYSLSCYDTEEDAQNAYDIFKISFKNIESTLGDAIGSGSLSENDGLITNSNKITKHFEFYEYIDFDPHSCFTICKVLL